MRKAQRAAIAICAVLATLAFAGSAFASFSPKLVVAASPTQAASGGGATRIGVVVGTADDPTARVVIYVPTGYTVSSPAPGTKLGDVTATASALDLAGAVLPLTGELDAIPATTATDAAATACGVTPAQTWDLHLSAAGQTLDIPLFVVTPAAVEAQAGYVAKIVVCLPPPDVPVGTPGRATFGAKLLSATFTSSAITQPGSGDHRWTSVWTPYTPNTGKANPAGSVEVQSLRHLPTQVQLTVAKKKLTSYKRRRVHGKVRRVKVVRTLVRYSASATTNGTEPSAVSITTTVNGKKARGASGSFVLAAGKSARIVSTAAVDESAGPVPTGQPASPLDLRYVDLGTAGCIPSAIFGGIPCSSATTGGETVRATVRVVAYRR